ncbi:hypothetical protein [Hypericibacter sp.]|uniref:hypothetical protein n=1 Tax=Hypericibacter sp. TaxID=2705401 RepID=UPI003D6CEC55
MKLRLALWLTGALALSPWGVSPAQADSACPYLTRPLVEIENGVTRINQWEHGTLLCYRGRMLRCEVGTWYDYGNCPQGLDWQARDAVTQEQNAHPEGVTTPAPASPAEISLPAPPTMSQPLPEMTSPTPAEPPPTPPASAAPAGPVTTALPSAPKIMIPPYDQPPESGTTAPDSPAESATEPTPVDCSDMQRLTFERLFNKSFVESQRCQAACTTDACKLECENQHENVRGPKLMERFHSDACSASWYP